jgi:NitT/TauT family transport system ATP-binding protein
MPTHFAAKRPEAVSVERLSLSFLSRDKRASVDVIDCIDLAVSDSEFIAIVGPSGCGKTSILKIVGALLERSDPNVRIAGSVTVKGLSPREAKAARMFGFTFQNPVLLPWRNVRKNIELPLEISCRRKSADSEAVDQLVDLMDVREFESAYPAQLSGGMQQRINIARALVHQPAILLMDEPFGSLDEVTRERLNVALLRIHRVKRPTVVFVTHSLREAAFLADRIVVLTSRPTRVKAIIASPLPFDRNENIQFDRSFLDLWTQVKQVLFEVEHAE